ncbi:30S ribosomal protein S5 [Candidatus Peregrinibacteria bacterium CG10_big_fil_rev_8_21_14_0_10_49_10]|nr:MAG: 30S ribosomal protein S5 [Candidatus Peregrinibacteria bacterium CG10_big_fil_rev_8_21_14_0_10_49_10]
MAKTSQPERRKNQRSSRREPKEYDETTLSVDRVTRVVSGGRRMRFRAVVVVGNKKGKVGLGTGKANDVQSAVQKATTYAKRSMIRIPLINGTIPHEVNTKHKAARIRLIPAAEGTGVIAGGALRVVLEHAGVKNVLSKRYGSSNKLVNAQCIMKAFDQLHGAPAPEGDIAVVAEEGEQSGKKKVAKDVKVQQAENANADEEAMEGVEIKEISREDVDEEGNLKAPLV